MVIIPSTVAEYRNVFAGRLDAFSSALECDVLLLYTALVELVAGC